MSWVGVGDYVRRVGTPHVGRIVGIDVDLDSGGVTLTVETASGTQTRWYAYPEDLEEACLDDYEQAERTYAIVQARVALEGGGP